MMQKSKNLLVFGKISESWFGNPKCKGCRVSRFLILRQCSVRYGKRSSQNIADTRSIQRFYVPLENVNFLPSVNNQKRNILK